MLVIRVLAKWFVSFIQPYGGITVEYTWEVLIFVIAAQTCDAELMLIEISLHQPDAPAPASTTTMTLPLDNVIKCQCVCNEVDLLNNQCYSFFISLIESHC